MVTEVIDTGIGIAKDR